ncbi:type VII secretion-associated serine protease mycosin [Nocardia sp. NPDC005978]|uniref:type VII secretion-associated serine protease mycosin n=1 Tax=Nocardia sp. NPDC005978 TaxID=3156725 RepID=UPI0033BB4A7A
MVALTPAALAIAPPEVLPGPAPADAPGPEFAMKQDKACLAAGVLADSDLTRVPPPETTLDLRAARALSRGRGITVAILDTGVTPHLRLPNLIGGGDFVLNAGDGLFDCDAHGTLIAGIIGAASDPADAFQGVAPDAQLLSIRVRSNAFTAENPTSYDPAEQVAVQIRALARAITRAANQGAGVIVVPNSICVPVILGIDQAMLSAAVGYATIERGALIVAGAGSAKGGECAQNPGPDPAHPGDVRNWRGVQTISTPSWFGPTVLSVAATTASGTPLTDSLAGPWISIAAPGVGIESLGPGGGGLINGVGAPGAYTAVGGTSFATAYVAGVAALLRSRFPSEAPAQIIARLRGTAHAPARGMDNAVGAGMIDPLAALSPRNPPADSESLFRSTLLTMPSPGPTRDDRPTHVAFAIFLLATLTASAATATTILLRRDS